MSHLEPGLELLPGLTLLRPLGRGGMGEAWLARDAERGEEVVAKVVPADASPERVALLRREARLVRKLAHPRIVPVYGFRSGERGSAVTLRYMPGGDAGDWLRDGDALRLGPTRVEVAPPGGRRAPRRSSALAEESPTEPPVVLVPPPRDERLAPGDAPSRRADPADRLHAAPAPVRRPARRRIGRADARPRGLLLAAVAVRRLRVAAGRRRRRDRRPSPTRWPCAARWPVARLGSRFVALPGRYTLVAEKAGLPPPRGAGRGDGRGGAGAAPRDAAPARAASPWTPAGSPGPRCRWTAGPSATTPLAAFEAEAGEREVRVRAGGLRGVPGARRDRGAGRGAARSRWRSCRLPTPPPGPPPRRRRRPCSSCAASRRARGSRWTARVGARRRSSSRLEPGHGARGAGDEGRPRRRGALGRRCAPGQRREETRAPRAPARRGAGSRRGRRTRSCSWTASPRAGPTRRCSSWPVPHEIEIRREGYETVTQTVTPRPGFPQTVSVALKSLRAGARRRRPASRARRRATSCGSSRGARFKMGASRREPGRRANEPLARRRARAAVLRGDPRGLERCSSAASRPGHSSGRVGAESLDLDDQPVVRVTWQQAAAYCNWLSERGGAADRPTSSATAACAAGRPARHRLPPADGGRVGAGGALPRRARGRSSTRGARRCRCRPGPGNYADAKARGLVAPGARGVRRRLPGDGARAEPSPRTRSASWTSAATSRSGPTTSTRSRPRSRASSRATRSARRRASTM